MEVKSSKRFLGKGFFMKSALSLLLFLASFSTQAAITIGAYNIRNFDYDVRYKITTNKTELSSIIKNLNVDVLSIEEINNTAKWDEFVATKLPGYDTEVSRCGGAHGQHLGFLYNKNKVELLAFNEDLRVSEPGGNPGCDTGSRPLAIGLFRIKATGQKFYGMTAHLKSGSNPSSLQKRLKQFEAIKTLVSELKAKTDVKEFYLAGDLNTTSFNTRGPDYAQLNKVVSELGMVNLTSKVGCSAYWWGGSDDGVEDPSLLDHVIATPGLIKTSSPRANLYGHCQKVSCRQARERDLGISYESVSDHCPITATIQ